MTCFGLLVNLLEHLPQRLDTFFEFFKVDMMRSNITVEELFQEKLANLVPVIHQHTQKSMKWYLKSFKKHVRKRNVEQQLPGMVVMPVETTTQIM